MQFLTSLSSCFDCLLFRDNLLLETGFLCILVAPLTLIRGSRGVREHDRVTFWLTRWLLFRLMFASGVVKLTSRCPTWWGLTGTDEWLYGCHLCCLYTVRQWCHVFFSHFILSFSSIWLLSPSFCCVLNSPHVSLRDSVYPNPSGLVCPPVASVLAEAERGGSLRYRDRCSVPVLQSTAEAPTWSFLLAGEKKWIFSRFALVSPAVLSTSMLALKWNQSVFSPRVGAASSLHHFVWQLQLLQPADCDPLSVTSGWSPCLLLVTQGIQDW